MIFYTADPHFYHKNIIRYCDRPFQNIKEMHNTLIKNWNKVVGPDDYVYVVGDFAMVNKNETGRIRKILHELNGSKELILGNHDLCKPFDYVEAGFNAVHTAMQIEDFTEHQPYKVLMHHDPCIACGTPPGTVFIHGHIHNLFKCVPDKMAVCVCVENWDYTPVTLSQIMEEMNKAAGAYIL